MFTSTSLLFSLPLLSLASVQHLPLVAHRRLTRALRARADPSTLSSGSLTTAEGCTKFRNMIVGEYCILVASDEGITLAEFCEWTSFSGDSNTRLTSCLRPSDAMNPQIDSDCMNLYAGKDYCVARTSAFYSSSRGPEFPMG